MLTIFGAVAELEREYILQRQREGIAIAKEQGKYTGRNSFLLTNSTPLVVNRSTKSSRSRVFRANRLMDSTITVSPRRTYSWAHCLPAVGGMYRMKVRAYIHSLKDHEHDRHVMGEAEIIRQIGDPEHY